MKIKKYILMLAAGILGFTACTDELEEVRLLDPSEVVSPVLHQLPAEVVITKDNSAETINFVWDKAYFGQNVEILYTIFGSSDGGTTKVKLYTVSKETSYSVKYSSLNSALVKDKAAGGLGLEGGVPASVVFTVGATVGSNYQYYYSDNMVVNITPVAAATGNPWADFTEESTWSLIGSIASVNMNWNADLMARTNGTQHVVTKVTLTTADQFKFRKDKAWGTNRGAEGDTEPYVMSVGETISCVNNGKNLAVAADGVYDVMYDEDAESITISEAWVAYPGFDEKSEWSVIGAIASREMEWNKDISMTTDGTWHVAEGVTLTTADQFKFRKDQAWGTNLGATGDTEPFVVTIGEEFTGAGNGKNLAVPADGVYDLLMNPDENLYKVVESLGGFSPLIGEEGGGEGGDDDDDKYKGWGIIGDFNSWGGDAPMTEKDNVWTGYITLAEAGTIKLRKDADWADNYGGTLISLGTAFDAVAGGDNIEIPAAGFYQIKLDLNNSPTITVSDGNVWSLIGVNGDWDNDIDMEESDGKWVSPVTKISGEFKLRYNHGWDVNRGGAFASVGVPFEAVAGGSNINVPEAEYIVTYDPDKELIIVDGALPADKWSLIGVNGDWNNDIFMTELGSGLWVSPVVEFGGEFKLRYNHGWDVNRGGSFAKYGVRFGVVKDGANINVPNGKYQIVYNPYLETVTVNTCTDGWSVIGAFEGHSWDTDLYLSRRGGEDPALSVGRRATTEDVIYESEAFTVTGGIKIRFNGGWDVNRGGTFAEDGVAFDVANNGDNISVGDAKGNLFKLVYNATKETITLKRVWCLIGQVNGSSWDKDIAMTETSENVWEGVATVNGEFKLRKCGTWDINRGGNNETLGTAFEVTHNGPNITVPEANKAYKVVYNAAEEKVTVTAN